MVKIKSKKPKKQTEIVAAKVEDVVTLPPSRMSDEPTPKQVSFIIFINCTSFQVQINYLMIKLLFFYV